MVDGIILDRAGIPTAVLCTDAFSGIADATAAMQGLPGYKYVAVSHPVEGRSESELMELSSQFIDEVIEILFGDPTEDGQE